MSLFAGITLTWYVICLPGNSQPQLRVSMGRGMLPPHSREEAVSLPCWLSGMVPQLPPSRPLHLLTSHPLMPLHNKTSNKILALHHGSRTLTIFVGLRLKKKKRQHVTGVGPHITGNGNCPAMAEEGGERVTGTELCLDLLCFLQCDYKTVILVILYGHDIK